MVDFEKDLEEFFNGRSDKEAEHQSKDMKINKRVEEFNESTLRPALFDLQAMMKKFKKSVSIGPIGNNGYTFAISGNGLELSCTILISKASDAIDDLIVTNKFWYPRKSDSVAFIEDNSNLIKNKAGAYLIENISIDDIKESILNLYKFAVS